MKEEDDPKKGVFGKIYLTFALSWLGFLIWIILQSDFFKPYFK